MRTICGNAMASKHMPLAFLVIPGNIKNRFESLMLTRCENANATDDQCRNQLEHIMLIVHVLNSTCLDMYVLLLCKLLLLLLWCCYCDDERWQLSNPAILCHHDFV